MLKLLSRLGARLIGSPISPKAALASDQSHQVQAILRDTQEEGLLSDVQTRMVDRIANIPGVRLSMVMIPLDRVHAVEIRSDRAALLGELTKRSLTRLPVWQNAPSEIVGFINVYDVLASGEEFTSLEKFLLPIRSLDADTPITEAINIMRREQLKIVLVTRRRGRRDVPLGIVTMKDLVEELLGELVRMVNVGRASPLAREARKGMHVLLSVSSVRAAFVLGRDLSCSPPPCWPTA